MSELYHYGIKGQRWNDRRYQYEDGSLTPEGKIRYGVGQGRRQPSGNYRPGNRIYSKSKPLNKNKVSKKAQRPIKPRKTNYNINKDLKKPVKSIAKDKSFIEKANDFLSTPVGRVIVGTAISGIIGIGMSILKEQVLVDLKFKNKKNEYMSEKDYNNKVKKQTSQNHKVEVDGKKTMDTIETGAKTFGTLQGLVDSFHPMDAPADYDAAKEAVKKKKK